MKIGQRIVVTDYGQHVISDETEQAYIGVFGRKRRGKFTKTSLARAEEALSADVSAISRLCWYTDRDVPKGLL